MTFQEAWKECPEGGRICLVFDNVRQFHSVCIIPGQCSEEGTQLSLAEVLSTAWEIKKPPMDFATAMKHLQEGKTVGRRSWRHCLLVAPDCGHVDDIFSSENLKATDWEVYD